MTCGEERERVCVCGCVCAQRAKSSVVGASGREGDVMGVGGRCWSGTYL